MRMCVVIRQANRWRRKRVKSRSGNASDRLLIGLESEITTVFACATVWPDGTEFDKCRSRSGDTRTPPGFDSVRETRRMRDSKLKGTLKRTSHAPRELIRFRGIGLDPLTPVSALGVRLINSTYSGTQRRGGLVTYGSCFGRAVLVLESSRVGLTSFSPAESTTGRAGLVRP